VEWFRKKNTKCKAQGWKDYSRNWEKMRDKLSRKTESRWNDFQNIIIRKWVQNISRLEGYRLLKNFLVSGIGTFIFYYFKCSDSALIFPRKYRDSDFYLLIFIFIFFLYCFIIHMCIQRLGHFSPMSPTSSDF
jgi:hypothetical protein